MLLVFSALSLLLLLFVAVTFTYGYCLISLCLYVLFTSKVTILTTCTFCITQDEERDVYRRDFTNPTLEDHFDKTVLPKVMQVTYSLASKSRLHRLSVRF